MKYKSMPMTGLAHRLGRILLVAAMLVTILPQVAQGQEADGPLLWLKFDENAGATTFADSGSGGANGLSLIHISEPTRPY